MRSFALLLLGLGLLLTACSTISIGEEEVFRPKASVTPQTFSLDGRVLRDTAIAVADSVEVNAWHLTQDEAEATVLFFGGNGFYLVQSRGYLRALTEPNTNALLWDYRGYGQSGGSPSVENLRSDALSVYDFVVDTMGVNPDRLILWGHSLGTFLATHVAVERDAAGVVLENPATDVDAWTDHLFPWFMRLFVNVEVDPSLRGESNLDRVADITVPLLVVGGEDDEVTDPQMARDLHAAAESAEKELVLVEGGGHNELYDEAVVEEAYRRLVEAVVRKATSPRVKPKGTSR